MSGNDTVWYPTCNLVWKERVRGNNKSFVLQQLWRATDGTEKWQDVPNLKFNQKPNIKN